MSGMGGKQGTPLGEADRQCRIVYCIVPRDLVAKLHERLRRHFAASQEVEVIVERRAGERRSAQERREVAGSDPAANRRVVRNLAGRRVGDRRGSPVPAVAPALPKRALRYAARLVFVECLEPAGERAEDLDSARLVTRFQGGDADAFGQLYLRYFDRVYAYLHVIFKSTHDAEDLAQQVFTRVLEALPRYELRGSPFRAWLFTIVRNHAVDRLQKESLLDLSEPAALDAQRERSQRSDGALDVLNWVSDRELLILIERLPLAQRQVLVMRYLLDLSTTEIAAILGRSRTSVSTLQYRALGFLRARLEAVGRVSSGRGTAPRMRRWGTPAAVLRSRRFALLRS